MEWGNIQVRTTGDLTAIVWRSKRYSQALSWKTHIDKILPILSSACFAMRAVKPFMAPQMLKAIYYSHFHSIISYGIIFWGHIASSIKSF
jgi:hypothetical protein